MHTPSLLFHASIYDNPDLKPGFYHTKVLVVWDKVESNKFLYASATEDTAITNAAIAALEKAFHVEHVQTDGFVFNIATNVSAAKILAELKKTIVHLYTIRPQPKHRWALVNNPYNNLKDEYKTDLVVDSDFDKNSFMLADWLDANRVRIHIKKIVAETPTRSMEYYPMGCSW